MTTRTSIRAIQGAVTCLLWLSASASAVEPAAAPIEPDLQIGPDVSIAESPIAIGDTLFIRIRGLDGPESENVDAWRVDDDGCVELPRLGWMQVEGLTESEAAELISRSYDGTLPGVTVTVRRVAAGADAPATGPSAAAAGGGTGTSSSTLAKWTVALRQVDVSGPVLAGIMAAVVAGLLLVCRGLRGRRVDEHPLCRRCAFDLFGLPAGHPRCPECGADLLRRPHRAVRIGHRERRAVALTFGTAVLAPGAAALAVVAWSTWQRTDPNDWKPAWWLTLDLKSADAKARRTAINHLTGRLMDGKLSQADIDRVAQRVLDLQADTSKPWSTDFGDFIENAESAKLLSPERRERYLRQFVPAEIVPPARMRHGSVFPVIVRVGPARLGKPMPHVGVEFGEPTIQVAGRAVDRAGLETISTFALRDAAELATDKMTVYDWGQLPHTVPDGVQQVRLALYLRLRVDLAGDDAAHDVIRHVERSERIEILPPEESGVDGAAR